MFSVNLDVDLDEFIDDLFDENSDDSMLMPPEGCLIGDHVDCKLRDGQLVARHEKSEGKITLTVVGRISLGEEIWEYIAFLPDYESGLIKPNFKLRPELAKRYGIHKKYIGEYGVTLRKNNIIRISHRADGMLCSNCDEFYDKAESNQEDGTLICWSCRQNPWR